MKTLLIWGIGSQAGNLIETLKALPEKRFKDFAFLCDILPEQALKGIFKDIPYLGNRSLLSRLSPQDYAVYPAVGLPNKRQIMTQYIQSHQFEIPTIVDPRAIIEADVTLEAGCMIRAFCHVGYGVKMGAGVFLNTGSKVSHETEIGDYCSLFPGATVLGQSHLETGVLVGANASIAPQCKIGEWSKVSMGSAVLQDLPAYVTAQGNPAKIIKQYQGPEPIELLDLPQS